MSAAAPPAPSRPLAAPPGDPAFTAEQRAAIADRGGSALLAANAGSGKTAVMVERFVEAVLQDEVAVHAILALTFTEKAAGELRERIRRRFSELGRDDLAREAEGAWVGTIHGFCARVLRSHPLAAGLDPRFAVLPELAAQRIAHAAFERALDGFAAERGDPALDLAAAYGPALRDLVLRAYGELRSRGETRPRLPVPAGAVADPDPAALAAARAAAAAELGAAAPGRTVAKGLAGLEACEAVLDGLGARVPYPGELDRGGLVKGARALETPACATYREAFAAYRQACADHHARADLALIAALLDRFAGAYAEGKTARAGVDFEDLELGVRDLLAGDPALRDRWAARFALIMVDEFQDTNRLQLEVLEALERDNGFAVGDELQSIYGFRHADVRIFRERAAALGEDRTRRLSANFRSDAELLGVLNATFASHLGPAFAPLVAGREGGGGGSGSVRGGDALRLFDPDLGEPPVELLVTDAKGWEAREAELGLEGLPDKQPHKRAEAGLVARRLRQEVDDGRREGDLVVLVRATASLPLLEQALEEEGLPTYVVGGRGYWSQEQVRDGLAYLRALANPLDEEALLGVLAAPFAGAGADALVLAAQAGGEPGAGGLWAALRAAFGSGAELGAPADWPSALPAAERERVARLVRLLESERAHAARLPAEVLLERAVAASGYDLEVLARPDGERRLANLRKLMRLAREYERSEGRDLPGFLAFAATQELAGAREGEAPLEGEGLNAIRLMTIHRAKGLEFPVVCVADLGRAPAGDTQPLLIGHDGEVGLRLATPGGGAAVPALAHAALAERRARAADDEERRLLYVAMTRARDRLILSGGVDAAKWPEPAPHRAPLTWIARGLLGDEPAAQLSEHEPDRTLDLAWEGRPTRVRARLFTASEPLPRPHRRRTASATAMPARPGLAGAGGAGGTELTAPADGGLAAIERHPPAVPAARPRRLAPARLSYSALGDYARCPYRFYLRRVLGLPDVAEPPPLPGGPRAPEPEYDALHRGSLVHALLEELDFRRPIAPSAAKVEQLDPRLPAAEVERVRELVAAFARSPLCARLARAGRAGVRREAPFAFALEPSDDAPLLTGYVDVMASEPDGAALVVDYKTDRLDPDTTPGEAVQRSYATQRLVYALAALRGGAPRVEVAHCYLERPAEPATATYAAADAPALADRLRALAGGVLRDEFPVTPEPHRELCGTCPGRAALCSHPPERTLQPSAGAFSGIDGPS